MIMVVLVNFILLCKYTGQVISLVDDYDKILITKIGLAKTHMSLISKAGNYIAHWDLLCEDDVGNQYIIYTHKFNNEDENIKHKIKKIDSILFNSMALEGNRSVFIDRRQNIPWKYKQDRIFELNRSIPLPTVVEVFSINLQNKYNVLDYNCFHNCRKTVENFGQIENPYFNIKQKKFTFNNLLVDLFKVIN